MGGSSHRDSAAEFDYYGLKDVVLLIDRTVKELFPLQPRRDSRSSSSFYYDAPDYPPSPSTGHSAALGRRVSMIAKRQMPAPSPSRPSRDDDDMDVDEAPEIKEWIAYMLYRTGLSEHNILFSLHLLRRLSKLCYPERRSSFAFPSDFLSTQPDPSPHLQPDSPLFHHAWFLSALVLATNYFVDDTFHVSSWVVAARKIVTIPELSLMELDLLALLQWKLRLPRENLPFILDKMQHDWKTEVMELELKEKEMRVRRKQEERRSRLETKERERERRRNSVLSAASEQHSHARALAQVLGGLFSNWSHGHGQPHGPPRPLPLEKEMELARVPTFMSSHSSCSGLSSIITPACSRTSIGWAS